MTDLRRNETNKINELLEIFPVVLILGVRQCGKTSLAKLMRPDWKYFDLENTKDKAFITADYDFFFSENPQHIIIDEAQESPELFKNLRGVIDDRRNVNNRFILTGSSSPELVKLSSDSLAGRIGIVELGTLKVNEQISVPIPSFYEIFMGSISETTFSFLKNLTPNTDKDILQFFLRGGYPQPTQYKEDRMFDLWMNSYFDTYINRDVRKLFPKLNIEKYQRFIQMLSELSGTIINRAELGRSLDISEVTVRDYLDIADKTFIWRNIPSYEKSQSKSLVKMPKGILRDSGLCHFLSEIHTREQLIRSPKVGQNFESFIIEEMIKGVHSKNIPNLKYFYYRTKHGAEVDLILTGKFGVVPIEIKFSTSTDPRKLSSLSRFLQQENLPLGVVVNNSNEVTMLTKNIIQIPASYL